MSDAHDDQLWFVQFSADEVRALTLDALDEAFQAGSIDESTLVREDGSTVWTTLGAMLGGDAHVHAPAEVAPISVAPQSAAPPPVVAELDALDDEPKFGASRKRAAILGALAAVAVLAAVGVTATRLVSSGGLADASKVGASMGGVGSFGATARGSDGVLVAPDLGSLVPDAGPRFNDEQRRLLIEADKRREAEAAARRPVRSGSNAPSRPIKMGDPISKGGSKYDPLNGQL